MGASRRLGDVPPSTDGEREDDGCKCCNLHAMARTLGSACARVFLFVKRECIAECRQRQFGNERFLNGRGGLCGNFFRLGLLFREALGFFLFD